MQYERSYNTATELPAGALQTWEWDAIMTWVMMPTPRQLEAAGFKVQFRHKRHIRWNGVDINGGITTVAIYDPLTGRLFQGVARCLDEERYVKAIGRAYATRDAIGSRIDILERTLPQEPTNPEEV